MYLNYFAYGSNMLAKRLKRRVPSARFVSAATLKGFSLQFCKRSLDGSGKCTLMASHPNAVVHGVIFSILAKERSLLDIAEGLGHGYGLIETTLHVGGNAMHVFAYIASDSHINQALKPYDWYKALVIAGAKQFKLPKAYIHLIEAVESLPDPNLDRARLQWNIIEPQE